MYKKIALCFCLLATAFLGADSLLVGTNAEFPPFSYIEDNQIVGFDIDVAKEVAKRLDKEIEFKDMPFEALLPDVLLGQVDFVAAGMSYTEERAQRVAFAKSHHAADPLVVVSKEGLTMDDLKGKKVVVIEGFTADLFVSAQKGLDVVRLPTQADGFLALKSARADAFVTAKSTISSFMDQQEDSSYQIRTIAGTEETYAIVVPKSKPQMLADVQKALDAMQQDGTMQQLKGKWKLL